MSEKNGNFANKKLIALLTIGLSFVGLVVGLWMPTPVLNTMSAGTWISFVAFLLSLGSVENDGGNILAKIAFTLSFIMMTVTVFFSTF